MIQFSRQISEIFSVSETLAKEFCISFENGDNVYYLSDYHSIISVELETSQVFEIYAFLTKVASLSAKKKRLINGLIKANKNDKALEDRIQYITAEHEIDDLLAGLHLNPRSRGQIALAKGIGPLVDEILAQKDGDTTLEELASPYVGKDPSFATAEDVLAAASDVIVERFGTDETARSMTRDCAFEKGLIEVTPKVKKDKRFTAYAGKLVTLADVPQENLQMLLAAEDEKAARVKITVQLFAISELLRQHFIENPDSLSFDFLCIAIDECYSRWLQPIVERDVKDRIKSDAETILLRTISVDLEKTLSESAAVVSGSYLSIGAPEADHIPLIAFDSTGKLLQATSVKSFTLDRVVFSTRLKQIILRNRPSIIITPTHETSDALEELIKRALHDEVFSCTITRLAPDVDCSALVASEWMSLTCADLDMALRKAFANGILFAKPLGLVPHIGTRHFALHPKQHLISEARFNEVFNRIIVSTELHKGLILSKFFDSAAAKELVEPEQLAILRKNVSSITSKALIQTIPGLTPATAHAISGYLVITDAVDPIDRTTVHPNHAGLVKEIASQLGVSLESIISDPGSIRSIPCDDFALKIYIEKKLIGQLQVGQKYVSASANTIRRKLKLTEITEDSVVAGRVTNVTPFGVFVDINAVCDGLIHISQLADGYVETPDQVVSVNDRIKVRIVKVDVKKRRISLSMKGLGDQGPRIKPTQNHLSNLADHFKKR